MGVVYAGEFAGKRVKLNSKQKILYVQNGKEKVPLIGDNVEDYHFTDGNSRDYYRTFTINWCDGTKSVMKIEKPYVDFLVSGVETGPYNGKQVPIWVGIISGFIVFLLVWFLFFDGHKDDSSSTSSSVSYSKIIWEEWADPDSEPSGNAEAYVYINPDYTGYSDDDGQYYIMGRIYNNTIKAWDTAWIQFGLYANGVKVGSCSAKLAFKLLPERVWNYRAICGEWPYGSTYTLETLEIK